MPVAYSTCRICSEIAGNYDVWAELFEGSDLGSTKLVSGKYFDLLLPVGPLCEGHTLIVPRRHVTSIRALIAEEKTRLLEAISCLRTLYRSNFGHVLFFEHGCSENYDPLLTCVDHAHLHVVPAKNPVADSMRRQIPGTMRTECPSAILETNHHNYVLLIDTDETTWISLERNLPSQMMRRLVWANEGISGHWDWRKDKKVSVMSATRSQLGDIITRVTSIL